MKKSILVLAAVMALGGCATTTSSPAPEYHAAAQPGASGYYNAPADNGRQTIVYTGDKAMSRAQVAEFAMLRAAEFTTESSNTWFAVLSSTTHSVTAGRADDLSSRGGHFLGTGPQQGGDAGVADARGAVDNSSAPFGGTQVPNQVLERWRPATVYQTVLIIQPGSGSSVTFEGLAKQPEIFSAKSVTEEIRAKMTKQ